MGRFKTDAARAWKKWKRAGMENLKEEPVPKGWRNNIKNQELFRKLREQRAAKTK